MRRLADSVLHSTVELGTLSAALLLLRLCLEDGEGALDAAREECNRALPVFDALGRTVRTPEDLARFERRLDQLVEQTGAELRDIETLVCAGMEAELTDRLADRFPERRLVIVPHDERADRNRIRSNYGRSVLVTDTAGVEAFAHPFETALVVPVFDGGEDSLLTTYPIAARILNDDTTRTFAEVVAIDLLGVPLHYYSPALARIPDVRFTRIIPVDVKPALPAPAIPEEVTR
ncbi:MAG: hypothetical protein GC159_07000 [Phycisphaera sp.]|nr:hypothetical protein [Phycisphaera sp.]